MKRVALFEFDNVICDTLGHIRKSNIPFSFSNINDIQKRMDYHAYAKVMMYVLKNKGYSNEIYYRRKRYDRNGTVVKQWLDDNNFHYDKLYVIDKKDTITKIITGHTYLISTSVDDAILLNQNKILSSATIVNCEVNRTLQLPNYCDRLYYT